jgi:hypothetical protein
MNRPCNVITMYLHAAIGTVKCNLQKLFPENHAIYFPSMRSANGLTIMGYYPATATTA